MVVHSQSTIHLFTRYMRLSRHPRWSRILVLLALFQVVAPSVAAIADAWRIDGRVAYDHIESESSSTCVVVHHHNCALCSIATGISGAPPRVVPIYEQCKFHGLVRFELERSFQVALRQASPPRAPPALES